MHVQFMTTVTNPVQAAGPRRSLTQLAIAVIALLTCSVAGAALPVQQLTVAFTNGYPNASVATLTMPNNAPQIVATNPLTPNGTTQNLYTAVVMVTNPVTGTVDAFYADEEQQKIWKLPGPSYTSPSAIFSFS